MQRAFALPPPVDSPKLADTLASGHGGGGYLKEGPTDLLPPSVGGCAITALPPCDSSEIKACKALKP